MTDDPIQAAAERLTDDLRAMDGLEPYDTRKEFIALIVAAFREQRAEAATHLDRTAEQWHRAWLDETNDSDRFEAERDKALIEIRDAREACPIVRRQDYFDATLLQAVNKTVSQLFWMQSERDKWLEAFNNSEQFQNGPTKRAEAAEARCTRLEAALRAHGKHPANCPKGVGIGYYKPPADAVCNCGIDAALGEKG